MSGILEQVVSQSTVEIDHDHPMFSHPDDTTWVDGRADPIADVRNLQFAHGPIVRGVSIDGGRAMQFGDIVLPNITVLPQRLENGVFAALTWDAGQAIFGNQAVYSASVFHETTGALWGRGIFEMDGDEHATFRRHMQAGLMPRLVKSWEESIILPVLDRHFKRLKPRGQADLVRELNAFYPYDIIGQVVGYNPDDIRFVAGQFLKMHRMNVDPAGAFEASAKLKAYSKALIEKRRQEPRDDMVSAIAGSEVAGAEIPEEIFIAMVTHLMQGGIDTVYRLSSNLMSMLLDHPDQFEMLRERRELIPRAVEEALRHQGVPAMLPRVALADNEVLGVHIPKGSIVFNVFAAVNRDPSRWEDPDKFDILRQPKANMAFGYGPHACIGLHLARFEIARYMEHILDHMPNLRWDPAIAANPPRITGWGIRGTNSLPVVWDV